MHFVQEAVTYTKQNVFFIDYYGLVLSVYFQITLNEISDLKRPQREKTSNEIIS